MSDSSVGRLLVFQSEARWRKKKKILPPSVKLKKTCDSEFGSRKKTLWAWSSEGKINIGKYLPPISCSILCKQRGEKHIQFQRWSVFISSLCMAFNRWNANLWSLNSKVAMTTTSKDVCGWQLKGTTNLHTKVSVLPFILPWIHMWLYPNGGFKQKAMQTFVCAVCWKSVQPLSAVTSYQRPCTSLSPFTSIPYTH